MSTRHTKPRARQYPNASRARPATPPRPQVSLTGGPLHGCTVRADREVLATGTLLVAGSAGRYVQIDGAEWAWETDHQEHAATTERMPW